MDNITHITRNERQTPLPLSCLFRYISAYGYTQDRLEIVQDRLEKALIKAKETSRVQIVDDDGECILHVHPDQTVTLMLPWRSFSLVRK